MSTALRFIPEGWEAILEQAGFTLIAEMDQAGCYEALNQNLEAFMPMPPGQVLGHTPLELGLIHSEDIQTWSEGVRPLFESGQPVTVDCRMKDSQGTWRWVRSTASAIPAPSGEWRAIFLAKDLTDRRSSSEELRQREADYRALVEHAVDGIFLGSTRGEIIEANTRAQEMTGYSLDELLGMSISGIFGPEQLKHVPLRYDLLDQGQDVRSERVLLRKDGSRLPIEMNTRKLPDGRYQAFLRDVSEREAVARALRESEARYRTLFEHASLGIFHFDGDGVIRASNEALADILGATPEQARNFDMRKSVQNAGVLAAVEAAIRGERGFYEGEYRSVSAGKLTYLRLFTFGVQGQEGPSQGGIGMVEDCTVRKTAELALESESALLRAVIDHHPWSLQVVDGEGHTLRTNRAHTELFGSTPPPDYSIFNDPLLEQLGLNHLLERLRAGEVVFFPELDYNAHDLYPELPDVPVKIRTLAFPISLKEGLPELYVLMHENVAERRQAEESLRDSEQRLRTIFETSPECVKVVGSKGELLDMNAAGLAMLEADSVEEANRRSLVGFILPEYREAFRALHQKVMGGASAMLTFEIEGLRGTRRWLETHAAPMRNAEGRVSMLLGITRDVTERKAAEEQRRLLESQVQHSQKLESLGVLAGGIAHDFNNLLTALLGNLNLAQFKLPPESPAHHQLQAMEKILLKASDLTHQMLAYSGKGRFVVDYHDLNRIVQEMGHLLQVSISKKVVLRLHLAEGLPPIQSDLAQIQQVIMNLVTNASDAIGDAEGSIDLTTRLEQLDQDQLRHDFPGQAMAPGAFAALEVRDTGCGIPSEILPKIFDPFFSTKSSGRGLGLSAMQGILRGHGAGITIHTEVGRGATFKVFFPALTDLLAEAVAPPTAAPERASLKGRVLVVDDEEDLRLALAEALVHFGMEVVAARDGVEAVERFQTDPASFDLVVMDLTMPRMDGREAFRRLRQIRPDIRVLLSSGYSEQESLQNLLQQGLAGFIHKPYRLEELRKIVASTLG